MYSWIAEEDELNEGAEVPPVPGDRVVYQAHPCPSRDQDLNVKNHSAFGTYRGTSLIRNTHPPRITIGF